MLFSEILTICCAATLTICVALISASFSRAGRKAAVARLSLAVPTLSYAPEPAEVVRRNEMIFLRNPDNKPHQREMREVVRAFSWLKIAPQHARVALAIARLVVASLLAVLVFLLARRLLHAPGLLPACLALALIGGGGGWSLPMLLARGAADRRAAAIARGLPDALELLVVCVEAGLGLENALVRIAEALRAAEPLLAEELALTAADLRVLTQIDEGLANLAARVDLPDIRSVVMILSQSLRYGTPLVESLRTAAAQMRSEALIRMEERGNRLPTLLTLPMMLLIFPTIFLVVVGPAALNAMDAFTR